jgi:TonB C terminal
MSGAGIGTLAGIKRLAIVLGVGGMFFGVADMAGQSTGHPSGAVSSSQYAKDGTAQAVPRSPGTGVEILSDTRGVDFGPYLKHAFQMIKDTWFPLIPEEARPPIKAPAETVIRFTIGPDGKISAMHLDGGTRQAKFDRAAWGGIIGVGQFPPLPPDFNGPDLELRIHFLVNKRTITNP